VDLIKVEVPNEGLGHSDIFDQIVAIANLTTGPRDGPESNHGQHTAVQVSPSSLSSRKLVWELNQ
jgi:hypothetical protein